jgi:hypothetical protein
MDVFTVNSANENDGYIKELFSINKEALLKWKAQFAGPHCTN